MARTRGRIGLVVPESVGLSHRLRLPVYTMPEAALGRTSVKSGK
jgi:hypothetical protein